MTTPSEISRTHRLEMQLELELKLWEFVSIPRPLPEILTQLILLNEALYESMQCSILLLDKTGKPPSPGAAANYSQENASQDSWAQPIIDLNGRLWGTLKYQFPTPRIALPDDLAVMKRSCRLASLLLARQVETATLKESEERYRGLVQLSPDIIAVAFEGKIEFINQAGLDYYGAQSPDEILGRPLLDFFHPDSHPSVIDRFIQLRAGHSVPPVELKFLRKDGSSVDAESRAMPLPWKGKVAVLAIIHDITLRKKREAALIHSEERYRTLASLTPIGLFRTDPAGKITYVNEHISDMLGHSRTSLENNQGIICLHPDDTDLISAAWREAFEKIQPFKAEFRLRRTDGNFIWVFGHSMPEFSSENILVGFIGTVMDITERKQAEILSQKNQELIEENRRILESSRMKSEFLANLSHELRTPLNVIIGFSQLLIDEKAGALQPKQSEYLGDILKGGMDLLRLITDVLDLSKIEAGKLQLKRENFRVVSAIREVHEILMPMAMEKNIDLGISIDSSITDVWLDSGKFRQILFNLVSNALKFSNPSGKVLISVQPESQGGMHLRVIDHGIGVAATDIPKLFQHFKQLDSGFSRRYPGTGLGLVIVKKLVELHGGKVWMESKLGQGCTVHAIFPKILDLPATENHPAGE